MDNKTEIKVTSINGWFHCRLFVDDKLFAEEACELREDIGLICRLMLRDADKFYGVWNDHTQSARRRLNEKQISWNPKGRTKSIACR